MSENGQKWFKWSSSRLGFYKVRVTLMPFLSASASKSQSSSSDDSEIGRLFWSESISDADEAPEPDEMPEEPVQ